MIIRNKATWILLGSVFCVTCFLNFLVFKVDTTIAHLSTYAFILLIFILLKGKNLLGLSFALSLSFILTLQVVYVFLFGEKVSFSVLDSIIETNKVELFELSGHLFLKLILPSIIITFSLFMLVRQQREFSNYLKIMPIILILMSVFLTVKKVNARLISDVKEDVKEGGRFLRAVSVKVVVTIC